jgi:amino acid adenylation domain-containing protein
MSAVTSSPSSSERVASSACIPSVFALRVSEAPQAIAIRTDSSAWSYQDLDLLSNRIANKLLHSGVSHGSLVGLLLQRSPRAIAAMIGILKAGAAYVPLDVTYPIERLEFMIADTGLTVIATDAESLRQAGLSIDRTTAIIDVEQVGDESSDAPDIFVNASDLAYVMYTSGSSGEPKGVAIEQGSVIRLVSGQNYIDVSKADRFLQLASLSFDASTFEIWAPLLNGACLIVPPPHAPSLSEIAEALDRYRITTLWLTAGLFNALVDECPSSFRGLNRLLVGGDALSPAHVGKALQAMEDGCIINGYGPTETTTFACCHRVRPEDISAASIPIGIPISGTEVFILNDDLHPVSELESGEIYIAGSGIGRGYLRRPELTEERFVKNIFASDPAARMYRTGDIGRYNQRGEIEFLGRIDSQVKIRGFRIETSEVEIVAALCRGVAAAAVIVENKNSDNKCLCCFFVPRSENGISGVELEEFLRQKLPAYMVPARFIPVDNLPLNGNGKVDRKLLAEEQARTASTLKNASLEPKSLEARLAGILGGLLRVPSVGLDDDFFQLGGQSLIAARFFAQIETKFGKKLPLATIIHARTIRTLAAVIRDDHWAAPWSSLVPLKAAGSRAPFFLIHAVGGNVLNYGELAEGMPADQPVYALQAQGLDGQSPAASSVEEMAAHYIRAMDTVQPNGPYYLGGFSAGGIVALEMAVQLRRAGQQVALLGLIDSSIAPSFRALVRKRKFALAIQAFLGIVRFNLGYMSKISVGEFIKKKLRNFSMNSRILLFEIGRMTKKIAALAHGNSLPVEEAFLRAISRYDPAPYPGDAILLETEESELYSADKTLGWGDVIQGNLEIKTVPGDHDNLLERPQLDSLIHELVTAIHRASGASAS